VPPRQGARVGASRLVGKARQDAYMQVAAHWHEGTVPNRWHTKSLATVHPRVWTPLITKVKSIAARERLL